jgi:hypothetical protein
MLSFLPSCYSSYGALDSYPGETFTHCSCQPSLDAHFPLLIWPQTLGHQIRPMYESPTIRSERLK